MCEMMVEVLGFKIGLQVATSWIAEAVDEWVTEWDEWVGECGWVQLNVSVSAEKWHEWDEMTCASVSKLDISFSASTWGWPKSGGTSLGGSQLQGPAVAGRQPGLCRDWHQRGEPHRAYAAGGLRTNPQGASLDRLHSLQLLSIAIAGPLTRLVPYRLVVTWKAIKAYKGHRFRKARRFLQGSTSIKKEVPNIGYQWHEYAYVSPTFSVASNFGCLSRYKSREYRSRAVREPRKVLKEFGTELPKDMQVQPLQWSNSRPFVLESHGNKSWLLTWTILRSEIGWWTTKLTVVLSRERVG